MLPGYSVDDPTTRKTTHSKTLVYKSGFTYVHPLEGGQDSARIAQARAALNSTNMPKAAGMIVPGDTAGGDSSFMPSYVSLDGKVLQFDAYIKEDVPEIPAEGYRIRQFNICYFLVDDSIRIGELKQENSGIPQGTLIRRHRFPGVDGGYLVWQDLAVGIQLNIYGRSIQVVDCDKWTRSYYADQGMDQEPGEPLEEDGFMSTFMNTKKVEALRERTYEGMYREAQLGGGNINADMQQFMEWDRKVCRYYAIMDDITTPQFERRPFIICLYLANDTLEVREQYPLNAGDRKSVV